MSRGSSDRNDVSDVAARVIFFLGGFAVGGVGMMLLAKPWTADWVGAAGTWFGSIATVLTLLWAVRTFRADQAQRDHDARRRAVEQEQAAERAAHELITEAALVRPTLLGGSGFGGGDSLQMDSIHVRISNDTTHTATIDEVILDERLIPKRRWPSDFRVRAGETETWSVEVAPVPARDGELSGNRIDRYSLRIRYLLNGRAWWVTSDIDATPVPD